VASITHRDDVPVRRFEDGDLAFERRRLGAAAGSTRIGCSLFAVDPGMRQMPVHVHGDEEEIFYVVSGSGLSWQAGQACEIAAGDTIVHRPDGAAHTTIAGPEGMEVLVFASGSDSGIAWLPRCKAMWVGPAWLPADSPNPWEAEAAAGPLDPCTPGARPDNVVALADVDSGVHPGVKVRRVGTAAGSRRAGLNHALLPAGATGAPLHCHSMDEELFVVLEGGGTLTLGDAEHELRAGHVVARPPGTGVAHALRAGDDGIEYLVYGTHETGDVVYYPELGKVRLRGVGVMLDVE